MMSLSYANTWTSLWLWSAKCLASFSLTGNVYKNLVKVEWPSILYLTEEAPLMAMDNKMSIKQKTIWQLKRNTKSWSEIVEPVEGCNTVSLWYYGFMISGKKE
jgi:hypothetical protein